MPQLIGFFFTYRVFFSLAIFVILVFIFRKYFLPIFVSLSVATLLINKWRLINNNIKVFYLFLILRIKISILVFLNIFPLGIMINILELDYLYFSLIVIACLLNVLLTCMFKHTNFPNLLTMLAILVLSLIWVLYFSPLISTLILLGVPLDFELLFITIKRLFLEKAIVNCAEGKFIYFSDNPAQGNSNNPTQQANTSNDSNSDRIESLKRQNKRFNDKIKTIWKRIGVEVDREDYDWGRFSILINRLARLNQQKTLIASQLDYFRGNSSASVRNSDSRASRYLDELGFRGRRNN